MSDRITNLTVLFLHIIYYFSGFLLNLFVTFVSTERYVFIYYNIDKLRLRVCSFDYSVCWYLNVNIKRLRLVHVIRTHTSTRQLS